MPQLNPYNYLIIIIINFVIFILIYRYIYIKIYPKYLFNNMVNTKTISKIENIKFFT